MRKEVINYDDKISELSEEADKAKQYFQLLSTYNAYQVLLFKAKTDYGRKIAHFQQKYKFANCFTEWNDFLFSEFSNDELLKLKQISEVGKQDMIFLLDLDTVLRLNSSQMMGYYSGGYCSLSHEIIKIHDCDAKVYLQSVYCGDPYYCDRHFEDKEALGFFCDDRLITPGYQLEANLESFDNEDIRDILKPLPIDEIMERIDEVKDKKVKELIYK